MFTNALRICSVLFVDLWTMSRNSGYQSIGTSYQESYLFSMIWNSINLIKRYLWSINFLTIVRYISFNDIYLNIGCTKEKSEKAISIKIIDSKVYRKIIINLDIKQRLGYINNCIKLDLYYGSLINLYQDRDHKIMRSVTRLNNFLYNFAHWKLRLLRATNIGYVN